MRKCRGRVTLVQGQVRKYVAGIGDASVAAGRKTAVREAGQRAGALELALVPRASGRESDGGGVQQMTGLRLPDNPLRPARRLVTDSQMDQFGQRCNQPKRRVHVADSD